MNLKHIRRLVSGFVFVMLALAAVEYVPLKVAMMLPAAGLLYLCGFAWEMAWKSWREQRAATVRAGEDGNG
jgi:hypothetical protein